MRKLRENVKFPKNLSGNSEWMMATWPKSLSYDSNPGQLFILSIPEMASLVTEMVKNLPAMQETWVQSLGQEVPLEKGMATHSSNLAWGMLWIEEPGGLQSMGSQKVRHNWATNNFSFILKMVPNFMQICLCLYLRGGTR